MALSDIDRNLLDRCLNNKPRAGRTLLTGTWAWWSMSSTTRPNAARLRLSTSDREDLAAEVFLAIVDNNMAVLRHFRGQELAGDLSNGDRPPRGRP